MSIRQEYFEYLDHLGQTVTLRELFENNRSPDMIALRHDVDHDLDIALEMAYWEAKRGVRSTYYVLHTADYWKEPQFSDKCLQLQDYGHEVGLHLNILAEWMRGGAEAPAEELRKLITPLRAAGVRIEGVSPHGDRLCYDKQFINYWCFSELRPEHPAVAECGLSAEGIPAESKQYAITYPESDRLVRADGKTLDLWSVSMNELGIAYDAVHVRMDSYYTDTGGWWHRSLDPRRRDLGSGRHQVLMHPVHWRDPQRVVFFLSAARSGSKWLVNLLEKATPLTARHEFSLNHRFTDGRLREEKRTGPGLTELVENKAEARSLLAETRAWTRDLKRDYAEANVYLEMFLPELDAAFPDAALVHLHRDPRDVVRSIMNRDWYDTPEDDRHPVMDVGGFGRLSQFEKACWYVRRVNEKLSDWCERRVSFERMVADQAYLAEVLGSLKIPIFERLARVEFDKKINVNYDYTFPEYARWSAGQKATFHQICDPVNLALGYRDRGPTHLWGMLLRRVAKAKRKLLAGLRRRLVEGPRQVVAIDFAEARAKAFTAKGCRLVPSDGGLRAIPDGDSHAHVLIGGGAWHRLRFGAGWQARAAPYYYRGELTADISHTGAAQLLCLTYGSRGALVGKRILGRIRAGSRPLRFSFRVRRDVRRFNLAVHMSKGTLPEYVEPRRVVVEVVPSLD